MIYSDRLHDLPQTNRMVPHMTRRCQSRSGSVNVLKQDGMCYCQNVGCIPLLGDGSIWSSTHWSRDGRTTMPHIYHVLMMAHIDTYSISKRLEPSVVQTAPKPRSFFQPAAWLSKDAYTYCSGWWFQPLWKMWVGMMTFPTEWKNNPFMFQTTNQYYYIYILIYLYL